MAIFDFFEEQGDKILGLFHEIEKAQDRKTRLPAFEQLWMELELRTRIEDEIFFPRLRRDARTAPLIVHNRDQNALILRIATDLSTLPMDELWNTKLAGLRAQVARHLTEQFGKLYPLAREVLSPIQTRDLGERAADLIQQRGYRCADPDTLRR